MKFGRTTPMLDENGEVRYVINEMKTEELMDAKVAADVLDRLSDGFFTLNENWAFTNLNPVSCLHFKRKKEQLLGKSFFDMVTTSEDVVFLEEYSTAMDLKKPVSFEAPHNGRLFSVQVYPLKDGGIAVFYRNITEKKIVEEELKEALETKSEFISIASHELKTPLTALKLQVEMARRSFEKNDESLSKEKFQQIINRTHGDIERLSRLVDDMLDVSRINHGRFNMHFEFFDLEEFMDECLERASSAIKNFRQQVRIKVKAPVMVRWDRFRIEQVVLNILTNAFRYGGDSEVEVSVTAGGGYAYISIKDQGQGISPENQKKIFEKYEKGNHNRTTEGLGLGLYISNEIIKQHGGQIKLQSAPGKGSTFELQLPLSI